MTLSAPLNGVLGLTMKRLKLSKSDAETRSIVEDAMDVAVTFGRAQAFAECTSRLDRLAR